jgi:hypothetical protein
MKFFRWLKHRFLVATGKKMCSGYRVYPDSFRCPGCNDCKGKNKISPYHWP